MSTNAKTVVWVIIAVIIIGGGIWWWMSMSTTATAPTYTNPTSAANPTQNPTNTAPTSTPTTQPPANDVTASGDSNAALQGDLTNTDAQMNGFSSDNTNINNGMNDQPVQQSQY